MCVLGLLDALVGTFELVILSLLELFFGEVEGVTGLLGGTFALLGGCAEATVGGFDFFFVTVGVVEFCFELVFEDQLHFFDDAEGVEGEAVDHVGVFGGFFLLFLFEVLEEVAL